LRFHDIAIPSSVEICTAILAVNLTPVNAQEARHSIGSGGPGKRNFAQRAAGARE
jgi:hypothetical protein